MVKGWHWVWWLPTISLGRVKLWEAHSISPWKWGFPEGTDRLPTTNYSGAMLVSGRVIQGILAVSFTKPSLWFSGGRILQDAPRAYPMRFPSIKSWTKIENIFSCHLYIPSHFFVCLIGMCHQFGSLVVHIFCHMDEYTVRSTNKKTTNICSVQAIISDC